MPEQKQVLVRIPEELWLAVKHDCVEKSDNMTSLVKRLLEEYIAKQAKKTKV